MSDPIRNYQDFGGKILSVVDEGTPQFKGTGITLPAAYFTVRTFNFFATSLNTALACWDKAQRFNDGYLNIGQFDKYYPLSSEEFAGFQTGNSQMITEFLDLTRTLCNATPGAVFQHLKVNPLEGIIKIEFEENGKAYPFKESGEAYSSTVNSEQFQPFKDAMYEIAFGIAASKEPEFWANAIDAV